MCILGMTIKHYDAVDFEVPMTLSLYNYYSEDNIENVFNWVPSEKQWWITGFSPDFDDPHVEDMISICSIDLSEHTDMYNSLSKATNSREYLELKDYLILDEDNYMVWILWGGAA